MLAAICIIYFTMKANESTDFNLKLSVYGSIASLYGIWFTIIELLTVKSQNEEIAKEVKLVSLKYENIIVENKIKEIQNLVSEIQIFLSDEQYFISSLKLNSLYSALIILKNSNSLKEHSRSTLRSKIDLLKTYINGTIDDEGKLNFKGRLSKDIRNLLKGIEDEIEEVKSFLERR